MKNKKLLLMLIIPLFIACDDNNKDEEIQEYPFNENIIGVWKGIDNIRWGTEATYKFNKDRTAYYKGDFEYYFFIDESTLRLNRKKEGEFIHGFTQKIQFFESTDSIKIGDHIFYKVIE